MPNMDDVYGGNTLKAEDLPVDFRGTFTVESVTPHEFEKDDGGKEKKLLMRFVGKSKGLALNVTNANMMAEVAGSRDYDYWPGKQIVMYRTMTDFGGRRVPAIRLDHPNGRSAPRPSAPPPPAPRPEPPPDHPFQATDADVPF